jgi:hypothetical protein
MDIGKLDTVSACNAGAEIELMHPVTQKRLGIFVNVLGKDSDVCREHFRVTVNDNLRKAAMAKKRGKDEEVQTYEKSLERGIDLLVACTLGWRTVDDGQETPTITMNGEAMAYTKANAKRLYEAMPWIKTQVDEAIVDLENFI